MTTRADVVAEARSWVGTPYQHQQSMKGVACDCIGLIRGVAKNLALPGAIEFENDLRFKGYGMPPNPRLLVACDEYMDRVPIADGLPGDVVLARVEIEPQHFGIISSLDPVRMIHSYIQVDAVTENIVDEFWKAHVLRIYRYRGVE